MTTELRPQAWFEMLDLRRRFFNRAAWIPLRISETTRLEDGAEDTLAASGVGFLDENREEAEKLGWNDIGLGFDGGPYAYKQKCYKPCEIYQYHEGKDLGISFVFSQHVGAGHDPIWHLSQDLIFALNLIQEGDIWVRPQEGYIDVVRQRRAPDGEIIAIEIRSEFFRDYLAARRLSFRLAIYRQRVMIMADASYIGWPDNGISEVFENERYSANIFEVDSAGCRYGGGVAVFHMGRTDVDNEEDVPVFGPETDKNTTSTTSHWTRGGPKFYRVEGEIWRQEWIAPSTRSERVRGDDPADVISFTIESSGQRLASKELESENIGRWLWFDPGVILSLISRRGGGLRWHTAETGSVWCSPGWPVHFGIDRTNSINVYAYDVAKLPPWQQRIWAGYNVTPNGPVSAELLSSQMRGRPAGTHAPETALIDLIAALDERFMEWLGHALFRSHEATDSIAASIHRFRATDRNGLLALAKDITRLIVDRIDASSLQAFIKPPKGERWGSLKTLEKALSKISSDEDARRALASIVGTYELRVGDAHVPSSKINDAFLLAGIDQKKPIIHQGRDLIDQNARSLYAVLRILENLGDTKVET